MKQIIRFLIFGIALTTISCDKEEETVQADFYNLNDRIGYWINSERGDTLFFINDTEVRRYYNGEQDFLYRIYDNTLFLQISMSLTETRHDILDNTENKVQIDNMYRGHEGTINYGTYRKLAD
ncbi:MAG: hypothetical protein ACOCWM_05350 [Cyclobacteriaceae bacterium]